MEETYLTDFSIVQLSKPDLIYFQNLIQLYSRVFENETSEIPEAGYLEKLLEKNDFLALAVIHENKVVGGLTGYELQKYQRKETEFFIYDLAVDPVFQQRGLGTRLIASLKEICYKKGITEFFVDAHQEDTHALKFYESITSRQDAVVQFSFV